MGSLSNRAGGRGAGRLLAGKMPPRPDTVVILSGGNVDPALHARIMNHEL